MKMLVVVQARMGSTRLPGKVLLPVAGAPMLQRQLERIRAARTSFELIVATSASAADDPIRQLCRRIDVACFSGHPTDLLDRHYRAARTTDADWVVKIPSDCPLIDPAAIDRVLAVPLTEPERFDFVSNLHPASYPDGNDVEAMSIAALETAWREARAPHEREHTTPFLWDQPERFRIGNVAWETGGDESMNLRFTVDYADDYAFVSMVYRELWRRWSAFGISEILDLLERRPALRRVNASYAGVNWYRHHLGELRTVGAAETRALAVEAAS
jgi:spore coat polysaccharide biosynthesis protein SpsF